MINNTNEQLVFAKNEWFTSFPLIRSREKIPTGRLFLKQIFSAILMAKTVLPIAGRAAKIIKFDLFNPLINLSSWMSLSVAGSIDNCPETKISCPLRGVAIIARALAAASSSNNSGRNPLPPGPIL